MITIANAEQMHQLGVQLSAHLRAGDLVLVNGPLGAGKTVLAQGVGEGLGITGVTSPTFVIARIHKGPLPLIHVDAYRLLEGGNAAAFLDDLDLDSPREGAVTVIEWGGAESARLSEERLEITIDRRSDIREVTFNKVGARWQEFSV